MAILLRKTANGSTMTIAEPSGKKIKESDLKEGWVYLHKNLWLYRKIINFKNGDIFWMDKYWPGFCSIWAFLNVCKTEITKEEKDFLDYGKN